MPRQRNRQEIAVGARYQHRDAPNVTWEVIGLYMGVDGKQHAVLSNVSDPTWHKTISMIELKKNGHYARVPTL
jgi:hypothetical protein